MATVFLASHAGVFSGLGRRFCILECRNWKHFPGLYCLKKKKMEKWKMFDQNHGLIPLEKSQLFDFLNFSFL